MKKLLSLFIMAIMVVSAVPFAFAQDAVKDSDAVVAKTAKIAKVDESLLRARHDKLRELKVSRDRVKTERAKRGNLRDLSRDYRERKADFNHARYRLALLDSLEVARRVADFSGETTSDIDGVIEDVRSLPDEPTREDFERIEARLRALKQHIKQLRMRWKEANKMHRQESKDHLDRRLANLMDKMDSRLGARATATCRELLQDKDSESMRATVNCLKRIRNSA